MMAEEGKKKKPIVKIIIGVLVVLVAIALFGGANESKDYSADSANGSAGEQMSSTASSSSADEQMSSTASSASDSTSSTTSSASDNKADEAKYVVTDEVLDTSDPFYAYVKGTLTNNSSRDLSYIQVEYVLYDSDGAQIGTALANTNNLKSGGVWKFEAMSFEEPDSIASFELADVTAC